jgi:hypothetical protein
MRGASGWNVIASYSYTDAEVTHRAGHSGLRF